MLGLEAVLKTNTKHAATNLVTRTKDGNRIPATGLPFYSNVVQTVTP